MNTVNTEELPLSNDVKLALGSLPEIDNPSLILDKYCKLKGGTTGSDARGADSRARDNGKDNDASRKSLDRVCKAKAHNDLAHNRSLRFWSDICEQYGDRARFVVARLEGRLAINLADGLIENAGIILDRLTGVPFIPGSAIKGVARNAADETCRDNAMIDAVFGSEDSKKSGEICFLPAYPLSAAPLVVDITNVHYPKYYQTGKIENLKEEKPQPNPFPTVEKGAQFVFCIVGDNRAKEDNLENAEKWLKSALEKHGIGAKTAAGYGWFSIQSNDDLNTEFEKLGQKREAVRKADADKLAKEREEAARKKAEEERRVKMTPVDLAREDLLRLDDEAFANCAKTLADKEEETQLALLSLLLDNKEKRERWKKWKKKKPETEKVVRAVAEKLKITLP